jgi:site-specific DNA recombinase
VLAFYIRLSSEDRDLKTNALKNESNSVFNQRRLLQDYYDTHESLHGYKVIVFCDDGVTGTHFDRPKFDELIEMARNQEIHCIMVKDLSRFGRNFLEMGNYLELILPLYGVRFISINDAFDSDDYLGVTGGLELALRNLINNMYSRDLSTKVRSAYRTRNLRGEYWGGSSFYGYQVHPHNKKRLSLRLQSQKLQGGECKLKTARVYLPCAIQ